MDSVIRSPRAGVTRARLGSARSETPAGALKHGASDAETALAPTELQQAKSALASASLRAEVEAAVRLELDSQAARLFEIRKQQGYEAGLAEGRRAAAEALRTAEARCRTAFDQALAGWMAAHAAWQGRVERDVGEIAFAAICRIVGQSALSKEFIEACVGQACASLRGDAAAKVRLHPSEKRLVEGSLDEIAQAHSLHLELIADASVASGGCVLEAPSGGYDASLATQLAKLHAILVAQRAEAID